MNSRRALQRVLPIAGALAGVAFLVIVARPHWDAVRAASRGLDPAWLAVAVAGLGVHLGIVFVVWRLCLAASGATVPARVAADTWVPSLLARYVPGRVWSHGVRMMLARRAGLALPEVTAAVSWEILMAIGAAGVVALAASSTAPIDARLRLAVAVATAVCVGALIVAQLLASRSDAYPLLRRLGLRQPVSARLLAALAAAHFAGWAVYGGAHWAFARAIGPISSADVGLVTAGVALAWIGGYVAVFTPAGLGVREGLLALVLTPMLGAGPVVLLAGLSRLGTIGVEILLFAAWSVGRTSSAKRLPERA